MKRIIFLFIVHLICIPYTFSQNWDYIKESGEYYYGEGTGVTEDEAGKVALDNLLQQIAVHVSSDFTSIYDGVSENGQLSHKESVRQCVRTYAQSSLTNVQSWTVSTEPKAIVRKYMLRSELQKMYDERIKRLRGMVRTADYALNKGNIDVALQYYYWAYSFVRSLQFPANVTDEQGMPLVNILPLKIQDIIRDIKVNYVTREGDFVDLNFTYQGRPATVDFTYNDGRKDGCDGKAEGGNACIEMAPGYAGTGVYHINIEYEYKNFARGDAEVQSVLSVIPRRNFGEEIVVRAKGGTPKSTAYKAQPQLPTAIKGAATTTGNKSNNASDYADKMKIVLKALSNKKYDEAYHCFIGRGYDNFVKLIARRSGRIIGNPSISFDKGVGDLVYARGLQMAFSVTERGHKTTLVDDVIFTFDKDKNICNVTFGIGSIAENDLRLKKVDWGEETRQQILDFLENYKTAYCLKDSDYIEAIFDENATIIVGNVAKKTTRPGYEENRISDMGKEIITYTRYTKSEYIKHLKRVFKRNQFINIKFTENDVMKMENESGKVFSIQIGQEYSSSTYADKGYLFLMVDMTNPNEPLIKIRTWQPKPDPTWGIFGPGHFTK